MFNPNYADAAQGGGFGGGNFFQQLAGMGGLGGIGVAPPPTAYDDYFKAYSTAMMSTRSERANLNHGGKIIMPPSALARLTNLELESPWTFHLQNPRSAALETHAGVLEFIAEEGVVYLPPWMMRTLGLREGDPIRVTGARLPKGKHVKIQAQNLEFLEVSDPKAVLESCLRNFSCLTQGDTFSISYNSIAFEFLVIETLPAGPGISCQDTDLEVDFDTPKGYVEPAAPAPKSVETMASKLNIDVNSTVPSRTGSVSGAGDAEAEAAFEAFIGGGRTLNGRRTKGKGLTRKIEEVDEGSKIYRTDKSRFIPTSSLASGSTDKVPSALNLPPGKLFFGWSYKAYDPNAPTPLSGSTSTKPEPTPAFSNLVSAGATLSGRAPWSSSSNPGSIDSSTRPSAAPSPAPIPGRPVSAAPKPPNKEDENALDDKPVDPWAKLSGSGGETMRSRSRPYQKPFFSQSIRSTVVRRSAPLVQNFSTTVFKMAPIPKDSVKTDSYDLLVIGGGSGGLASARRASSYGAKVAIIEASHRLGGTCVNVGCVPKKIMWYTADIAEHLKNAHSYGFRVPGLTDAPAEQPIPFDWNTLKTKRDAYIHRLNGIYEKNLEKDHVDEYQGHASFKNKNELEVKGPDGNTFSLKGDKIIIAVGGQPTYPDIEGAEHGITSDGFFELEEQPKRVAVVGAGYIAVELAGIFHTLGSETHIMIRHDRILRTFDPIIQDTLTEHIEGTGINVHKQTNVKKVEKTSSGALTLHLDSGKTVEVDCLLWAIGRHSMTEKLNLEAVGVKKVENGDIPFDKFQVSNVPNIFVIGDVGGKALLTPVAIAAGRRLSNRLFGGEKYKGEFLDYTNIPSVVFSHPTAGSVGLTEPEAREKYRDDKIKIYRTKFTGMSNAMLDNPAHKSPTAYKLVCLLPEEKILGVHIVGEGSDEMMQFIGVAVKMGATKKDLDDTVAIHPTSAEELVTLR
ncbi:glutathione-disulfide reductase [Phaffia rhodozyma]|uniref:Glutathione reductase n=1 Tax=Phaffia rhodozyma TaxID=264483 RepID=A0A0F7SQZ4_PHARH|nr:glutathione-disulfide reductase [Phaffia rhodozyma]